jgi:hypothetical protein
VIEGGPIRKYDGSKAKARTGVAKGVETAISGIEGYRACPEPTETERTGKASLSFKGHQSHPDSIAAEDTSHRHRSKRQQPTVTGAILLRWL